MNDFQNCSSQLEAWMFVFELAVLVAIFVLLILGIFKVDLFDYYRKGQIDALNGKIKFEKKENSEGEIVWHEIVNNAK